MTIPAERFSAAMWVYQFTVASFVVTMMAVPYNAAIIAKENMKIFAIISVVEVVLKLVIVYILFLFSTDKLKLYAVLMFLSTIIIRTIYSIYCKRTYTEFKFSILWDKEIFKSLISYSGWNLFGAIASVLNNQGINILLNLFFTPVINAARGIAMQINNVINQFVQNFMLASRPQITKYYAENKKKEMFELVFKSSKFSFYLIAFLAIPALVKMEFLLNLWLKEVPNYTIIFSRLIIVVSLIDSFSYSLVASAQATGKIKKYQTVVGSMLMLNVPISYIFLKLGFTPEWTLYIAIFVSVSCLFLRLLMLKQMLNFPVMRFMADAVLKPVVVVLLGSVLPLLFHLNFEDTNLLGLIYFSGIYIIPMVISIFLFGLAKNEKQYFLKIINENKVYKYIIKLWSQKRN